MVGKIRLEIKLVKVLADHARLLRLLFEGKSKEPLLLMAVIIQKLPLVLQGNPTAKNLVEGIKADKITICYACNSCSCLLK